MERGDVELDESEHYGMELASAVREASVCRRLGNRRSGGRAPQRGNYRRLIERGTLGVHSLLRISGLRQPKAAPLAAASPSAEGVGELSERSQTRLLHQRRRLGWRRAPSRGRSNHTDFII